MDNDLIVTEKERKKEKRKLYRDIVFIILLGLLLIWFTGSFLANRNNIENNDNEIKTELVSRSNKFIKQANRKNLDIKNNLLSYYDNTLNTLELTYQVCNVYVTDENDNYYYLNNTLNLIYDLNFNVFTYNEFEVEFSDDTGDYYYLNYFTPNGFNDYLTMLPNTSARIDTYIDGGDLCCYLEDDSVTPYFNFDYLFNVSNSSIIDITYFGSYFYIDRIVNEVIALKDLINSKYNDGLIVGEEIGYNDGYDNGYDEGYDVGYQEGNASGYQNGYSAGLELGENQGYSEGYSEGFADGKGEGLMEGYDNGYDEGYQEGLVSSEGYELGYDEGYDIGHNRGYEQGLSVGLNQGYDTGFIDGQKDTVNEKGFKTLFNAIMNAPYNIFKGILNFEFLGVNLFSLFSFIFTTMLILWIVKIFKK